jgi:hypothetical protein
MADTTRTAQNIDQSPSSKSNDRYHLRAATYSDISSIARIWADAFFDDEIIGQLMHPHRKQYPKDVYWFLLRGNREHYWDWKHRYIVVTVDDKDGKGEQIVGAADWRRLGKGGEARELAWGDPSKSCFAMDRPHNGSNFRLKSVI